jgi:type VI secretion system protein ImpK
MAVDLWDDLTSDCFGAIIQLRRMGAGGALPDPQMLYGRLCWFIDSMTQRARQANVSNEDLGDLVYAVVALADEVALAIPQTHQVWMAAPLQLRYFNENLAGENFFNRLQGLRQNTARYGLLRIYYVCLLLGFQGRYRMRGAEMELQGLIDGLQLDLARQKFIEEEVLSPHGGRPANETGGVRRNLPILWFSLAAVGLAFVVNLGLHWSLGSRADSVVDRIAELAGTKKK